MSRTLDDLLAEMDQQHKPAMTIEQLREMSQEDNNRQAAMSQMNAAQNQINGQQAGWPSLRNLGQGAGKLSVTPPKKTTRHYEVIIADYDDHTVEADEVVINGNFLIFMLAGQIQLITTNERVVSVKEEE